MGQEEQNIKLSSLTLEIKLNSENPGISDNSGLNQIHFTTVTPWKTYPSAIDGSFPVTPWKTAPFFLEGVFPKEGSMHLLYLYGKLLHIYAMDEAFPVPLRTTSPSAIDRACPKQDLFCEEGNQK